MNVLICLVPRMWIAHCVVEKTLQYPEHAPIHSTTVGGDVHVRYYLSTERFIQQLTYSVGNPTPATTSAVITTVSSEVARTYVVEALTQYASLGEHITISTVVSATASS